MLPIHASTSIHPSLPCFPSLPQKTSSSAPALRTPYLRVLGLELDTSLATSPGSRGFTAEEEEEFGEMSRGDGLYDRFARSVAPSIFGNLGESRGVRRVEWV